MSRRCLVRQSSWTNTDTSFMWVEFDTVAYKKFLHLGRTIPDDTGVMVVPSFDYYDTLTDDTQNPWFKDVVEDVSQPLFLIWVQKDPAESTGLECFAYALVLSSSRSSVLNTSHTALLRLAIVIQQVIHDLIPLLNSAHVAFSIY